PVKVLTPSASAATIRARFVRLFEPGTRTRADWGGLARGVMVISEGRSAVALMLAHSEGWGGDPSGARASASRLSSSSGVTPEIKNRLVREASPDSKPTCDAL